MMHKVKYLKKIIALFAAIIFAVTSLPATIGFADSTARLGDVFQDEKITSQDALEVLKYAARLISLDETQKAAADVNKDDSIDAEDALLILKYAAKMIDVFPAGTDETVPPAPSETAESEATETVSEVPSETTEPEATETASPKPSETKEPEVTKTPTPGLSESEEPLVAFSGEFWIVGDSIAAYHEKSGYERPLYGWGELLRKYYTKDIRFVNMAVSSESSKSYHDRQYPTYQLVYNKLAENDYIIISFGHNDHNTALLNGFDRTTDPEKGSDVPGSYKYYLKHYYIDPALEKGAVPILMSSVVRCFYSNGRFDEEAVHLKYGKAMRELVEEYAAQGITIYFIDAQTYTYDLYSTLTEDEAMLYHGLGQPSWGVWYKDTTHYSEAGARMICDFIVSELEKMPLELNNYRVD